MSLPYAAITGFRSTRPRYELTQERCLTWLAAMHAEAEAARTGLDDAARARFEIRMAHALERVACGPDKLAKRAHVAPLEDTLHASTRARTRAFAEIVDEYFAFEYAGESEPPDDLIHVTCTGYASPSGAQKLVADRRWGDTTRVTHAYHMGCYAAMPALRIASGSLATGARRVDIVHTELCSLHFRPEDHALDQLVVQSLFGDGLIRYRVVREGSAPALRVLAVHEHVLPESAQAMSWLVGDAGNHMALARDVPDRVGAAIRDFTVELFRRAGYHIADLARSVCAVHPGGPKIIDVVQVMLELDDTQVATSRAVLHDHGNMSSATLPHVWERILADPSVPAGSLVPSLAFGPGLTVCGALLEKRA